MDIFDVFERRGKKAGARPGKLEYTGEGRDFTPWVECLDFDETGVRARKCAPDELPGPEALDKGRARWVRVVGIHDPELVQAVAARYGMDLLHIEDLLQTAQRPKCDDAADFMFIVLKDVALDASARSLKLEQCSIVWGNGWVMSFQEREQSVWDAVRRRLEEPQRKLRAQGAEHLMTALLDAVVDSCQLAIWRLSEAMEEMEGRLLDMQNESNLQLIYELRRNAVYLSQMLQPFREAMRRLQSGAKENMETQTQRYLHDVMDHTTQAVEGARTLKDIATAMLGLYVSVSDLRMNSIMRVLTVVAAIFIPLTFITGIYGMNFEYMPGLKWRYGYYLTLCCMLVVAVGLLRYFRRRKWL